MVTRGQSLLALVLGVAFSMIGSAFIVSRSVPNEATIRHLVQDAVAAENTPAIKAERLALRQTVADLQDEVRALREDVVTANKNTVRLQGAFLEFIHAFRRPKRAK